MIGLFLGEKDLPIQILKKIEKKKLNYFIIDLTKNNRFKKKTRKNTSNYRKGNKCSFSRKKNQRKSKNSNGKNTKRVLFK